MVREERGRRVENGRGGRCGRRWRWLHFFGLAQFHYLQLAEGKPGPGQTLESQAEIEHGEKGELKHQGGQPGWSAEGGTTGHKGMDAMRWDGTGNHKHQRGSTERPQKGNWEPGAESSSWQRDLDLDLDSSKVTPGNHHGKAMGQKQPCSVVARLRLSASTRRHVTLPQGPKKDQTFHRSRLGEKEAGPCRQWRALASLRWTRRLHGQTVAETRFPDRALVSSPAAAWQPAHSVLPPACTRSRGLCFESR